MIFIFMNISPPLLSAYLLSFMSSDEFRPISSSKTFLPASRAAIVRAAELGSFEAIVSKLGSGTGLLSSP